MKSRCEQGRSECGKLTQLRADIDVGLADIRAGKVVKFDPAAVKRRGRARLAKQASKK